LPAFIKEMSEPRINLFGAATLGAPPDLGQIIVVEILPFILHRATP
jgi:hypothetical protein